MPGGVRASLRMDAPRIYADFQNMDDFNRLRLTSAGTLQDLERQGIQLQEGLLLTLYTDDAAQGGLSSHTLTRSPSSSFLHAPCQSPRHPVLHTPPFLKTRPLSKVPRPADHSQHCSLAQEQQRGEAAPDRNG